MKICCFGESLKTNLQHYTYKVRGFHLYNGQEAVLAGALHAMDLTKDKMITARNHVQPIGMGVDPKRNG
jgi:TPP-dependent pyruvate/acetoin dehydrogenase alpha subunit